jgi:uncharacterized small protein (DUF1192 family)
MPDRRRNGTSMAIDPDELLPRKPKSEIVLGQDISALSVVELEARIIALENEILRSREALKARAATKNAADAVFKR